MCKVIIMWIEFSFQTSMWKPYFQNERKYLGEEKYFHQKLPNKKLKDANLYFNDTYSNDLHGMNSKKIDVIK